jgi:hypothetical protein
MGISNLKSKDGYSRVPKVENFPDSRFLDTKTFQTERGIPIYD